jgi:MoxR-like ATPase
MMQKGDLRQDLFLVGPPGPARRGLALWYAELLRREVETLQISRDTSESDLKQRRELVRGGDAIFLDQAPVRAAINGSVLVLDGLEKAERNVSRAQRKRVV